MDTRAVDTRAVDTRAVDTRAAGTRRETVGQRTLGQESSKRWTPGRQYLIICVKCSVRSSTYVHVMGAGRKVTRAVVFHDTHGLNHWLMRSIVKLRG